MLLASDEARPWFKRDMESQFVITKQGLYYLGMTIKKDEKVLPYINEDIYMVTTVKADPNSKTSSATSTDFLI